MTDTEHRPQDSQPQAEAAPRRDTRPQPQYGELAPEGWEWTPPEDQGEHGESSLPGVDPLHAPAAGDRSTAAGTAGASSVDGRIPGVPHNLGVPGTGGEYGGGAPAQTVAPTQPAAPTQQTQPPQQTAHASQQPAPQLRTAAGSAQAGSQAPLRAGDRMITIVLLGIGAVSALTLASSLYTLPSALHRMAAATDVATATPPGWVGPAGIAGALAVLSLWTAALLWSIARIRAKKLAFWVPLAAAAVAMVVVFGIISTALFGVIPPEVMQDPEQLQRILSDMQQGL